MQERERQRPGRARQPDRLAHQEVERGQRLGRRRLGLAPRRAPGRGSGRAAPAASGGIEPTSSPRVRVISAAFQSPPRARQKTRAGSVGDSDGFCRSAAHGASALVEQEPDVEPAAEELGRVRPGALDQRAAPRRARRCASSRSMRATSTAEPAPAPRGGSASASSSRRKSARAAGTPRSGWASDQRRAPRRRAPAPRARGRSRSAAGGSSPTASRLTAPSGVTVIVVRARRGGAARGSGGGATAPRSARCSRDSHGIALRGSAAPARRGGRQRARRASSEAAPRARAHCASTGSVDLALRRRQIREDREAEQADDPDEQRDKRATSALCASRPALPVPA